MSRSISISVDPHMGHETDEHLRSLIVEAYRQQPKQAHPIESVPVESLDQAIETAKSQAQKSLLERHNIRWEPEVERLLILGQDDLEDYDEDDIEKVVQEAQEIIDASARITGKSFKHLADTW